MLEGAIECLQTVGYARTTARRVVAASQTNLGSIAYHFGSIEALRDEALREAAGRWLTPIVTAARAQHNDRSRLEDSLRTFMASLQQQRPIIVAFVDALAQVHRKPDLRKRLAAGYAELRAAIIETASDDRPDEALASLVMAIFDGLMLQWLIDPDRLQDGAELIDTLAPTLARLPLS